jgi:hypothetical protein
MICKWWGIEWEIREMGEVLGNNEGDLGNKSKGVILKYSNV